MKYLHPILPLAFLFFLAKNAAAQCGCPICPAYIHDEKTFNFPIIFEGATNNDLANPAQGVCEINLTIIHTWIGDARLELKSPAGNTVRFFGYTSNSNDNDNTVWAIKFLPCSVPAEPDMGFDSTFSSGQNWGIGQNWTGSYHPAEGCLEDFNTGPVNGTWTLTVADDANNDVGSVTEFSIVFCDPSGISCHGCTNLPAANFTAANDGFDVVFENLSTNSLAYTWNFGDGTSSENFDEIAPSHNFPLVGDYPVELTAYNECGVDYFTQNVAVAGAVPEPDFGFNVGAGCEPLGVHFSDSTTNNPTAWLWIMPGAQPDSSFLQNPTVTYSQPGIYSVTLVATNEVGDNSLTINDLIEVLTIPEAGFSAQPNGLSVVFANQSVGGTQSEWDFGDGTTSNEASPTHVFPAAGEYFVGLVSKNECGDDFFGKTIDLTTIGAAEPNVKNVEFLAIPNPASDGFRLVGHFLENEKSSVFLKNSTGQLIDYQLIAPENGSVDHYFSTQNLPSGLYFLEIKNPSANYRELLQILKN